ncbi:FRG domain-containing protein [Klenkia soli]|uniref:FRG domain-containing protein n=1 Tax=Klenkia soli TaxID=1052260 RepID=A0A1H0FU44_9ACTN|nr:FRG domain-containing protein [Klenkia soli]SDN98157.1 FRG domain-containing protein [Klenkia soli]
MPEQVDPAWVRSGRGHRVESVDEVFRAVSRVVTLAADRRYVWRGCPSSRLRVRSSLLRSLVVDEGEPLPDEVLVRQHEVALLARARSWGLADGCGPLATDLGLLAHLRRHGLPTRLLDVTGNPMTALWFACQDDEQPGVLLSFDVTSSPTYPEHRPVPEPADRSLRHALRRSALDGQPFLLRPAVPDARTQAQEGLFLSGAVPATGPAGGIDGLPLRLGPPPGRERLAALFAEGARQPGRPRRLPFCALVVPARLKPALRTHLAGLDRRRSVLFPDVDGFREAQAGGQVPLHPLPAVVPAHADTEVDEP